MEIRTLELSGFENYEHKTLFSFKDKNNKLIFDMHGPEKLFFFEAILGVIFGFENTEKEKFRGDPLLNKTFTAMITMKLDQRTMIIERDFETDFVACLISDSNSMRSVFQGKDYIRNNHPRPYLQVIKSIFQIIDKELFLEVCYQLTDHAKSKFSELLSILYFLLAPDFKFSKANLLINSCKTIEQESVAAQKGHSQTDKYRSLYRAVEHLINIKKYEEYIQADKSKLDLLIKKLQARRDLSRQTEQILDTKFSGIESFNPIQLKADVQIWKSLENIVEKNEKKIRDLKWHKQNINKILKSELSAYSKVPQTFNKDIRNHKDSQLKLNYFNEAHKDYKYMIKKVTDEISRSKKQFVSFSIFNSAAFFLVSYFIIGQFWLILIPLTLLPIPIGFSLSGYVQKGKIKKICQYQEEADRLKKQINIVKTECEGIAENIKVMDGEYDMDIHTQNYKKYQDYQAELQSIQEEILQTTELILSDEYHGQIKQFKKKYRKAIDINRDDLEEFLDEFYNTSEEFNKNKQNLDSYPAIKKLGAFVKSHSDRITELTKARLQLSKNLNIENGSLHLSEVLDKLDRKIKNLELS